jgi:hypothetical protein
MRAFFLLGVVAAVLLGSAPVRTDPPAPAAGSITVVDSPLVDRWLDRAGIPHSRRSGQDLGSSPISDSRLLILSLQSVHTPAAASVIEDFLKAGGHVVACYWGTLSPAGAELSPAYRLSSALGVKPVGWVGEAPQPLYLKEPGVGLYPAAGPRVSLPSTPAVIVEALPGTRIVGRWDGEDAGNLSGSRAGAIYLHGNAIYLSPALLRPGCDTNNCRETLFWAIQRVAPEIGPALQAKDRIATAAQGYSGALGLLAPTSLASDRAEANNVLVQLTDARGLLAKGSPLRATVAADHARALAERLIDRLRQQRDAGGAQP